jgi:hypothetical protein
MKSRSDPHGGEPGLDPFAGLGQRRRLLDAAQCMLDVGLPGRERNSVGQEADDRKHRDGDNAAADRNPRIEQFGRKKGRGIEGGPTGRAGGYRRLSTRDRLAGK